MLIDLYLNHKLVYSTKHSRDKTFRVFMIFAKPQMFFCEFSGARTRIRIFLMQLQEFFRILPRYYNCESFAHEYFVYAIW